MSWFFGLHPVAQALLATLGTWLVTTAGAALVFFTRQVSRRYLDSSLGFAAGVMTAVSASSISALSVR
jgi:ZIP family zinc transporter